MLTKAGCSTLGNEMQDLEGQTRWGALSNGMQGASNKVELSLNCSANSYLTVEAQGGKDCFSKVILFMRAPPPYNPIS